MARLRSRIQNLLHARLAERKESQRQAGIVMGLGHNGVNAAWHGDLAGVRLRSAIALSKYIGIDMNEFCKLYEEEYGKVGGVPEAALQGKQGKKV